MKRKDLHIDLDGRALIAGPESSRGVTLSWMQGDTYKLVLHGWLPATASSDFRVYAPASIEWTTLSAGVTLIDAAPTGGNAVVQVGDDTATIDYNISASALATALNGLASVTTAGGLTVAAGARSHFYTIQWNDPDEALPITFPNAGNKLKPLSVPRVLVDESIPGKVNLKLVRAPVAYTSSFSLPTPPAVQRTRPRLGTTLANELQRLRIPDGAVGSFALNNGQLIPVDGASATLIANALNEPYTSVSPTDIRFAVRNPARGVYEVEFIGAFAKAPQDLIAVEMFDQDPPDTPTALLQFKALAIEDMLAGEKSVKAVFEIVAADENGDETTLVQQECTIVNDALDAVVGSYISEVATAVETVYVYPTSTDPAIVALMGNKFVPGVLGDDFTLTHNFGTVEIDVRVIRKSAVSPDRFEGVDDVEFEWEAINNNQVQVIFAAPVPSSGVGSVQIWVRTMNAVPIVNNHRHDTDQIDGVGAEDGKTLTEIIEELRDALPLDWPNIPANKIVGQLTPDQIDLAKLGTALGGEQKFLETLRALASDATLINTIAAGLGTSDEFLQTLIEKITDPEVLKPLISGLGEMPEFATLIKSLTTGAPPEPGTIIIPDKEELFFGIWAADVPSEVAANPALIQGKGPGLLPAQHDAAVAALTVPVVLASTSGAGVYQNQSGGTLTIQAGYGRRSFALPDDGLVASDGRVWYPVRQSGASSTYYSSEADREYEPIPVNPGMCTAGGFVALEFDILLQLVRSKVKASCRVVVDVGTVVAATSPGTPDGGSIESISWSATPILSQRIRVSGLAVSHRLGVKVKRSASDVFTTEKLLYSTWSAASGEPAGTEFFLRIRCMDWDVEDGLSDPRGVVFVKFSNGIVSYE